MEHSRLLKYILSVNTDKKKMAEPVKIKFEYQNPDNVQSEVPGVQKLREDGENGNEAAPKRTMRRNNSYSGAQAQVDHQRFNRRHSNIANTTEDKTDEKKTRTRIPVSRFRQTVEKMKTERRQIKEKKDQESHIPVRRSSIPKATVKTPTPIKPVRKSIPTKKTKAEVVKPEVAQPEIERIEDVESFFAKEDPPEPTVNKTDVTNPTAPEDEFDKLYEEVAHSLTPINIDVSLLNPKVDDPEKLESKFEEIIHDYDENRVQPIDVEKIKKSRIPFLKRKSQQEIDVRGDRSGKMIAARDKLRMRRSSAKSDDVIDGKMDNNTVVNILDDDSKTFVQTHHIHLVNTANMDSQDELDTQNSVRIEDIESNEKSEDYNNKLVDQNDITVEEVSNKVFAEIEELKCNAQNDNDDEKSVNTVEVVDTEDPQSNVTVEVIETNDKFEDNEHELVAQNDGAVQEVSNKVFDDIEEKETNTQNDDDNEDEKLVKTRDIVDLNDTQNNITIKEIESNDKFEDDDQNDDTTVDFSNKVFVAIDKIECKAQNNNDYEISVNTGEVVDIDNTENNLRLEEIENNDFEDDKQEFDTQSEVIAEELSNNKIAEIKERDSNTQNDNDDKESINTRETVDIVETDDFQDNTNDENYESLANNVLVSPLIEENDNLKSSEDVATDIDSFKDEVTATSEPKEQKPELSIEIKTIEGDVKVEETINVNPSPVEDKLIELVDISPVSENSINVQDIDIITEQIKEENIYMNSIQIGIPVFDLQIQEQEHKEETDPDIEVREEPSYTTNYVEDNLDIVADEVIITEVNKEPIAIEVIHNTEISEIVDTSEEVKLVPEKQAEIDDIKILKKEKDGSMEDIAKLRGKVGRLISRIDSNDTIATHKVDIENDLPKKKSVLSKIAMFERHDAQPAFKSKIPKTKLPRLQTNIQTTNKVHIHTPLVVDEVFKPFPPKINHNTDVNNVEITNGDLSQIVKAEMAIIESSDSVYEEDNKIEIQPNAIEETKIPEKVLTEKQYDPKTVVIEDDNYKRWQNKAEDTVVVPKFVPVRDVLKRYESINNNHTSKNIVNIKTAKPISEIIKTLKPESNHRSLESMFAHQTKPVTDILNDLEPEYKDKALTITEKDNQESKFNKKIDKDSYEVENYDKTRHGFKSFKSRGYEYKTQESNDNNFKTLEYIQDYHNAKAKNEALKKAKSLAELDLDVVKGKVNKLVVRMNSLDVIGTETKEVTINQKELPRKRSVSEKIALFERKITPMRTEPPKSGKASPAPPPELTAELRAQIAELTAARQKYGTTETPAITLADGTAMPAIALGTALLDPRLVFHVVCAAIELGYRAIDTAYIYGNEKAVGEAIRAKIKDGTVTRGELFIMSKLWSTFHRRDLVAAACEASLAALGLDYFDLYMIHNPMSFKEGGDPIPKIATVLQYSEFDYLDAWFGMEALGDRARALGLSNFNAAQVQRVLDRARVKPLVNQVECHPYLSQQRLGDFCSERNVTLSCYSVLGSKGTPKEYKNGHPAAIDDPLVQVMASGLNVSPAQLLIRYQLQCGRQVVVKSSSAGNLWNNLQVGFNLTSAQFDAIRALNRNKRNFTFKGMGDTHKNYPFNAPF